MDGELFIEGDNVKEIIDKIIANQMEDVTVYITPNSVKGDGQDDAQDDKTGCGELRVLQRDNDLTYSVEIEVMRGGLNRNNWDYRNIREFAGTFKGCPILTAYVGSKIGDGHNMDEKTDVHGNKYYSTMSPYAERIVGCIGENEGDIRVEEKDGQEWIIARGKLWRFYHKELVDKIASQGRMSVSAETEVFEGTKEGSTEVYTNWRGLGVTILGDDVSPAVPGANVRALSEMQAAFNEMKLRAASLEEPSAGNAVEVNDEKKQGVKGNMNKKQLAELAKRFGDGCRVLAADEKRVCMLKDGEPCAYVFENADETIVPEHFQALSVNAVFKLNDETAFEVDIAEMTGEIAANCENAERLCAAEKERADKAEAEVARLRENEKQRRIDDVKNALKARMNEIVREMEVDGCEELCKGLEDDAEDYADDENCDNCGKWNGAERAVAALNAACMSRVLDAAKKKRDNERRTLAWDIVNNGGKDGDGLNGAIDRILR